MQTQKKLTKQVIHNYTYSDERAQWFLWDGGDGAVKGFGVRVTKTAKTFIFEGRVNRKSVRSSIGRFPDWSVDQARDRAKELSVKFDSGIDPREEEKQAALSSKTLGSLFDEYLSHRTLKPRTRSDYQGYMQKYFADWAKQSALTLTTDAVIAKYQDVAAAHGDTQANIAFRVLRAVLNHADDLLTVNVVRVLSRKRIWKPTRARNDHLSRHQVGPFVNAISEWHGRNSGSFVEFLLCTGCRRAEARKLKWKDIIVPAGELVFRDTKNTKEPDRKIPITSRVAAILKKMQQFRISGNPFVFAAIGKDGQSTSTVDVRKCLAFLNKKAKSDVTSHGLRRTATTLLANDLQCPSGAYKRILGHTVAGDVTETFYRQFDVATARVWLDKLDALITELAAASFDMKKTSRKR